MRSSQLSGIACVLVLTALPARVVAQQRSADAGKSVTAVPVRVVATTQASPRREGAFAAGDVNWTCTGVQCTATTARSAVMSACRMLARDVGTLQRVTVAGRALPVADLQRCNDVSSAVAATAPDVKRAAVPATPSPPADKLPRDTRHSTRLITADDYARTTRPLPDAPGRARATPRPPAPATPVEPPAPGPFVPVVLRTAAITLTGTGAAELSFRFTPVAVRTSMLTLTGTGAADVAYRFTPVSVRTARLTLTGTGRVE